MLPALLGPPKEERYICQLFGCFAVRFGKVKVGVSSLLGGGMDLSTGFRGKYPTSRGHPGCVPVLRPTTKSHQLRRQSSVRCRAEH